MSAILVGFGLFILGISLVVGSVVHYELTQEKKSLLNMENAKGLDGIRKAHNEAQRILSNYAKVSFVGILLTAIGIFSVCFIKFTEL